ncbi:hypothetical protein NESM_000295200 [Novymonas esmeraldas]|uniref:UTP23 sensor motif region domain-containing protein n=1 Tax=Novymonas esmeraldas TaxID=1808958 RepID=A0AAW0FEC8_9TRYP
MKRRVLRAHANKRCLRILSASNHLQASASSSVGAAGIGERGFAVLCDASFLRAVVLAYWQAHAPATWRDARRRKLRKAAAATHQIADVTPPAAATQSEESRAARRHVSTATAATMARLPFGALPPLSPYDFLVALLCDAFYGGANTNAVAGAPSATDAAAAAATATTAKFYCCCLPETVEALHRMRDTPAAAAAPAGAPPHAEAPPRHRVDATDAWLAASFGDGVTHRGGPAPSSAASALTFQEVPAAVVHELLRRCTLIAPDGALPPTPLRSEPRAVGEFMAANDVRLGRSALDGIDAAACDLGLLRLVAPPPPFRDGRGVTLSHQSAAAKRRRRKLSRAAAAASTAAGGDDDAAVPATSRPCVPRSYCVATQSHDVRRRLAAATPLLRLTTNPDALWVEQRGVAYPYPKDQAGGTRAERGGGAARSAPAPTHRRATAAPASASAPPPRRTSPAAAASAAGAATTTTVVAAAPQLSRADVAFMKHLGTAAGVPLPQRATAHTAPLQSTAGSKGDGGGGGGGAPVERKRRRERGVNPLSMRKKQKRETFRIA